jgi:hypothetical protein
LGGPAVFIRTVGGQRIKGAAECPIIDDRDNGKQFDIQAVG